MKAKHIHFLAAFVLTIGQTASFVVQPFRSIRQPSLQTTTASSSVLHASTKGKKSAAKGFAKEIEAVAEVVEKSSPVVETPVAPQEGFLQSVEGGSELVPVIDGAEPEDRAKQILRDKYGLKTLEEQQLDAKQLENWKNQQKQINEWKKQAEAGQDFDIMSMLPAPLLLGINWFLKAGVTISSVAFVLAGFAITLEAWSKTSGDPLPENIDSFIVNVVEPNFTPGLLVLLGFSVSLGVFAAAQLASSGAQYKEE